MERIALITGANRGIGRETGKQLHEKGWTVILTGRKQEGLNQINLEHFSGKAKVLKLDVTKDEDIEQAAKYVEKAFGKLDVLINNAGIMSEGEWGQNTSDEVDRDTLQKTFDVNLFSIVAVTQAMLPLLRRSKKGHIINVSSILGSQTIQADTSSDWSAVKPFAYNASKTALNMFTIHLSQKLATENIAVNSAHPGWVKTELGTDAAPMEIKEGAKTIVDLALIEDPPTGGFYHMDETLAW